MLLRSAYVAEQFGINFGLLGEVEKINAEQKQCFFQKVRSALWPFRGKKPACLAWPSRGYRRHPRFTSDPDHGDAVEGELLGGGLQSGGNGAHRRGVPASETMRYVPDAYAAAKDRGALLILTDWQEFGAPGGNALWV